MAKHRHIRISDVEPKALDLGQLAQALLAAVRAAEERQTAKPETLR